MWTELFHNRDKVGSREDGADLEKKGGVNRNEDGCRRDAVLQTLTQRVLSRTKERRRRFQLCSEKSVYSPQASQTLTPNSNK